MNTIELTALDYTVIESALRIARNIADTIHRQTGDDLVLHQHHARTEQAEHQAAMRELAATAMADYARAAQLVAEQASCATDQASHQASQPVSLALDEPVVAIVRRAVQVAFDHVGRLDQQATDESVLSRHHDLPGTVEGPPSWRCCTGRTPVTINASCTSWTTCRASPATAPPRPWEVTW